MDGQPVSNAEVEASKVDSGTGKLPTVYTDGQGAFLFGNLPPGTYSLSTSKEEDGYPPTYISFYSAGFVEVPQATVYEGQTTPDVVVRLGPRAAKLTGRVVEARTNKLIKVEKVRITLRRADDPDNSHTDVPNVSGRFEMLVPPVPVTVEVSAPGYERKNLGSFRLQQKEVIRLDVSLNRVE